MRGVYSDMRCAATDAILSAIAATWFVVGVCIPTFHRAPQQTRSFLDEKERIVVEAALGGFACWGMDHVPRWLVEMLSGRAP